MPIKRAGAKHIRPETQIPTKFPEKELAEFLLGRMAEGWEDHEIIDDYADEFLNTPMRTRDRANARARAKLWLRNFRDDPRAWDPYMDEMAIERAYMGDPEVWLTLTHLERQECLERIIGLQDRFMPHPKWPGKDARQGVVAWLDLMGEPHDRVANILNKRRQRARNGEA